LFIYNYITFLGLIAVGSITGWKGSISLYSSKYFVSKSSLS